MKTKAMELTQRITNMEIELNSLFSEMCKKLITPLVIEDYVGVDYIHPTSGRLIEVSVIEINSDGKITASDHDLGEDIDTTIFMISDFYQKMDLITIIQSHLKN